MKIEMSNTSCETTPNITVFKYVVAHLSVSGLSTFAV
jgi:hypothetical protein